MIERLLLDRQAAATPALISELITTAVSIPARALHRDGITARHENGVCSRRRQDDHRTGWPRHLDVAGSTLQVASKLKSLGVTIDSNLRFDRHVLFRCSDARRSSHTHRTGPSHFFCCCFIHLELSTCSHSTVRKHSHFQTPLENPSIQTHLVLCCIKRLCIFGPKRAIQIRYLTFFNLPRPATATAATATATTTTTTATA